jgi:predicted dehydrogenase/threonine dehydrogenase-like Zn-dependent dehydrogenase
MRQIFADCGDVVVKEVSQPALEENSVLVAVHYSFMSPSMERDLIGGRGSGVFSGISKKIHRAVTTSPAPELAAEKNAKANAVYAFGYSCSGRVMATGKKVHKFRVGDWVACAGAGYAHHADMVSVPESLVVKIADKKNVKAASLTSVGAVALQSVRRAKLQLGDTVCVVGLDLVGQLTAQLARLSGATVIGIDSHKPKLDLAISCGIDHALDINDDAVFTEVKLLTEQHGVDATIVTGTFANNKELECALEVTRKKGRIVLTHDVGLNLDRERLHQREIDLLIACSCGPGRHDASYEESGHDYPYAHVRWTENRNMRAFLHKVETGAVNIAPFVAEEISVSDLKLKNKQVKDSGSLGLVLRYTSDRGETHVAFRQPVPQLLEKKNNNEPLFKPATQATIRVGVVGTQWGLKQDLVTDVSKVRNISVDAIVDEDVATSVAVAHQYGVARTCTYDELFADDVVDAVVISSAHRLHASQTLHALQNGRAVFVEKPLATDFAQLEALRNFLCHYPNAPLCIDYSRGFSPFMEKITTVTSKRRAPLMVHYRINTGFVPKDLMMHGDAGAGRIIGDACQIIDLFCLMVNAQPVMVSVEALHASRDDLFPTDNFVASLSFEDGSVCSLIYTTLGSSESGNERMEIFFDGKSIVVDDYVGLYGFGVPSWFNETMNAPDYGKKVLMKNFFKELKKTVFEPPIPFDRLLLSTKLTLIVDQLACEGGGTKSLG